MSEPISQARFSDIAGHPALNLINTVSWRLSATRWRDNLVAFPDLILWASQFGPINAEQMALLTDAANADPEGAARELNRVRAVREGLYLATFGNTQPSSGSDVIAAEYADAVAAGRLVPSPPAFGETWGWSFNADLALPRRRIALMCTDFLTTVTPSTWRQCADDECGWVFVDTSPRHNRRWCVASDCGNRNRVRRHNERARSSAIRP